jgi:hypothetical protein
MHTTKRLVFLFSVVFIITSMLGAAWQTKKLTNTAGNSLNPKLAADGLNIYAVWDDDTPGNNEIYFKKSTDGGLTWESAKRLTNSADLSFRPSIAVNGANIYVTWQEEMTDDSEICFRKSMDGGATWQTAKQLTDNSGSSWMPVIAVEGTNVYIAWVDNTPGNNEIYFRRSIDSGATWQNAKRLTNTTGWSSSPAIALNGANIYVAWNDDTPGNHEIYIRKSTDSGANWQTAVRLTFNAGRSQTPTIAVKNNIIYVAWSDETPGNADIYFRKSTDGATSWMTEKRLTYTTYATYQPCLAFTGSSVYVAWADDNSAGNPDIFLKKSTNGGGSWEKAERLTNNSGRSDHPNIMISGTNIYVIWEENTPGNYEIYIKYALVE